MSNTQGAYDSGSRGGPWTKARGGTRWTGVELIAMVLGFMVFWPIGLAILGFKYWQYKTGGSDLQTVATGAFRNARSAMGGFQASAPGQWARQNWTNGFTSSTGNAAFDAWKGAEIARLEAERRRLEDAHREFSEWLETVRKAKDREEFERFMNERRARP
jgi:hypothetical protein